MQIERQAPCKINLLLNILGKRADGFHELETVMQPVPLFDRLSVRRSGRSIVLTTNHPNLPTDSRNLVYRAAALFLDALHTPDGVELQLEKTVPLAAGLGGGSSDAAHTLLALNELFGFPLPFTSLATLAASLGSDVPFFLQANPALAQGRGELIEPLVPFPVLRQTWLILIHPGFGIPTAWAYQQLSRFPTALQGKPGRAQALITSLNTKPLSALGDTVYNSLEAPALHKYPLLALYQEFLREHGAAATLMSGSGSSTFGILPNQASAEHAAAAFLSGFGDSAWVKTVPLSNA